MAELLKKKTDMKNRKKIQNYKIESQENLPQLNKNLTPHIRFNEY